MSAEVVDTPVLIDPLAQARAAGFDVGSAGAGCHPPAIYNTGALRAAWSKGWACGVFAARKKK